MLVVDDLRGAEAMQLLETGAPFAEVAARLSTDPSRSTGGLVDPVSRYDPSWPTPFRQALWNLEPGDVSKPIQVDDSYVLVFCGVELPADGTTLEAGRSAAEEIARTAQERLLMDELARRLLDPRRCDRSRPEAGLGDALIVRWASRPVARRRSVSGSPPAAGPSPPARRPKPAASSRSPIPAAGAPRSSRTGRSASAPAPAGDEGTQAGR